MFAVAMKSVCDRSKGISSSGRRRRVLVRVEDLEQGRGGIAAEILTDLVDLVDHDQGLFTPT
jgi:hypothetical protein